MRYSRRSTEPYRTIRIDSANDSNDSHDSPSTGGKPQTTNKLKQLDEALQVLVEFEPRKPRIEPSVPSTDPRLLSLTEEVRERLEKPALSLRLQQILDVFRTRQRTTPRQLGKLSSIAANTACAHLRNLERLGYLQRVGHGLYEAQL